MDIVEQNKIQHAFSTRQPSPRIPEKDWRQMNVMVPIFKQGAAPHLKRSNIIVNPDIDKTRFND
jgi:hypothetical protein